MKISTAQKVRLWFAAGTQVLALVCALAEPAIKSAAAAADKNERSLNDFISGWGLNCVMLDYETPSRQGRRSAVKR